MIDKPRVLAVTLARGGSKGVPLKNIRPILGVPLIGYTIAEVKRSRLIDRYIVSTDSPEIQKVAIDLGAEAPFLRPAELSLDTTPSAPAIQHAVAFAEAEEGRHYDVVIELMCTNPMKTVEDIDAAIEKLVVTGADSVIGVSRLEDHHPARIKKIVDDRLVDFCVPEPTTARRQDLSPEAYIRNGSIYCMNRDKLMIEGIRFGSANSRPLVMGADRAVNVDTEIDFELAALLLARSPRPHVRELGVAMGGQ
jgi:CMP-N-acetylneuraminic acid synthetase